MIETILLGIFSCIYLIVIYFYKKKIKSLEEVNKTLENIIESKDITIKNTEEYCRKFKKHWEKLRVT